MGFNFVPNIKWSSNPNPLPAELSAGVQVPQGVANSDVRAPNFVDVAGMSRLLQSQMARGAAGEQMKKVDGLVTKEFQARFDNTAKQWRCTPLAGPTSRQGPGKFQFQGGNVFLNHSLGIYLLNTHQPIPKDQISLDIFSVVYSHELLHVLDETDILKNWLNQKLRAEPTISRYLVQAQPFVYGNQSQPIDQVEREFHAQIQNTIETPAFNVWATESNRRKDLRDSPSEYKIVQDRVNELRSKYVYKH
jgi:hypothetical protein